MTVAGLGLLFAILAGALPSPGDEGSHEAYAREIGTAGARAATSALEAYDAHLRAHAGDATAAAERCELISAASDEEKPDLPLPPLEDCLRALERDFPESPAAALTRVKLTYGEKGVALAERLLADPKLVFSDKQRARIYQRLSQLDLAHGAASARAARKAVYLDPAVDLSTTLADRLLEQGRKSEAVVALSSRPEGSWFELQAKARKLADAGSFSRARWMLGLARMKGATADLRLQARIFEGLGMGAQAREAYEAQSAGWNKAEVLPRLFKLELAGSDGPAADRAYQLLRDLGWKQDPLGHRRLSLQWKFPKTRVRARDFIGLLALLGVLAGFALLPLVTFLPLHAWTLWRRLQRPRPEEPAPGAWWFRHLYLAFASFLLAQFLALYLFSYEEVASWLAPLKGVETSSPALGRFGLVYALLQSAALGWMLVRSPGRLRVLGAGAWPLLKCVRQAAFSLGVVFAAGAVASAISQRLGALPAALSVESLVRSLIETYGLFITLLVAAVLIPIGEELIFRSILLDVCARQLKFWKANLLQALLFAALHGNPARLVYYTVLGLLSGRLRRLSGGLLPSILLHAANNAIALLLVAAAGSQGAPGPGDLRKPLTAPEPELLACAKAAGVPVEGGKLSAGELNNAAWALAIGAATSRACLFAAEEAIEAALQTLPERGSFLDTKAAVLFRLDRLDEAIDLERAAIERSTSPSMFAQLDRFLRAREARSRPLSIGDAEAAVTLSPAPGAVAVDLKASLPDGFVLYAREAGGGAFFRLAAGPQHEASYRLPLPAGFPDQARFELSLFDTRGCDDCKGSGHRFRLERLETR